MQACHFRTSQDSFEGLSSSYQYRCLLLTLVPIWNPLFSWSTKLISVQVWGFPCARSNFLLLVLITIALALFSSPPTNQFITSLGYGRPPLIEKVWEYPASIQNPAIQLLIHIGWLLSLAVDIYQVEESDWPNKNIERAFLFWNFPPKIGCK